MSCLYDLQLTSFSSDFPLLRLIIAISRLIGVYIFHRASVIIIICIPHMMKNFPTIRSFHCSAQWQHCTPPMRNTYILPPYAVEPFWQQERGPPSGALVRSGGRHDDSYYDLPLDV